MTFRNASAPAPTVAVDSTADPATPFGWSENPSRWSVRLPLLGLALTGFGIALYLASYQWRLIATVWEPFFGDGSERILNSTLAHLLPVPDASLGASAYLLEAVLDGIGGKHRWRTHRRVVLAFGAAVLALGLGSILLAILQPVAFGHYCTLCLASAAISITIVGPAMAEVLAALQHQTGRRRRQPAINGSDVSRATPGGGSVAAGWLARLATVALGIWLMAAPSVLGYGAAASMSDRIVGPVVIAVGVIASHEVTRAIRWVAAPAGFWLLIAPWLLGYGQAAVVNSLVVGLLLIVLSLVRGASTKSYGDGWSALRPA